MEARTPIKRRFIKMHGLGNDFVVLDARDEPLVLNAARVARLADRRLGIGCDQVIVLGAAPGDGTEATMTIHNADGGTAGACGNAARCLVALLLAEGAAPPVRIGTPGGLIEGWPAGDDITVDMGAPGFDWRDIPLASEADTGALALGPPAPAAGCAVNMGNPHVVFFVDDAEAVDLAAIGPLLEHHPMFPRRANIGIASFGANGAIRLRVWERGTGITRACGSGACAALVAAARRGLSGRQADVRLDGGILHIVWRDDDHVEMTGPVATAFTGSVETGG